LSTRDQIQTYFSFSTGRTYHKT